LKNGKVLNHFAPAVYLAERWFLELIFAQTRTFWCHKLVLWQEKLLSIYF